MMKKYILINEVSKLLGLAQVSLRYIEKQYTSIKITKIRGIRHYTLENVKQIAKFIQESRGIEFNHLEFEDNFKKQTQSVEKCPNISLEKINNIDSKVTNQDGTKTISSIISNVLIGPELDTKEVKVNPMDQKPNIDKKNLKNKYDISQVSFFDNFGPPRSERNGIHNSDILQQLPPSITKLDTTTLSEYKERLINIREKLQCLLL